MLMMVAMMVMTMTMMMMMPFAFCPVLPRLPQRQEQHVKPLSRNVK